MRLWVIKLTFNTRLICCLYKNAKNHFLWKNIQLWDKLKIIYMYTHFIINRPYTCLSICIIGLMECLLNRNFYAASLQLTKSRQTVHTYII